MCVGLHAVVLMKSPPSHFTVAHQQAAGRARAALFTKDQLSAAGRKGADARMQQEGFYDHLLTIAPDGPARQRVQMRARRGARLLKVADVHLVRLEDIQGNLGEPWPESKCRLLLARYVWVYIWSGLREPARPTQQEFSALAVRARARVERGLALLNPLHVVGVAPNDFCNAVGRPYGWRNQRRLFRAALQQARDYACLLEALDDYFAFVLYREAVDAYFSTLEQTAQPGPYEAIPPEPGPRGLGRRRPMNTGKLYVPNVRPPRLPIHWRTRSWRHDRFCSLIDRYGTRTHCANLAQEDRTHLHYWLPPGTPAGDE